MPVLDDPIKEKFCQLYVAYGNATQAYREAKGGDFNERSARTIASKWLKDIDINARTAEIKKEFAENVTVTKQMLVDRLWSLVQTHKRVEDIFQKENPTAKEMKMVYAMANSGFIRGSDVMTAIGTLAKMLGYNEPEQVKQDQNIQIVIEEKSRDKE